VYRGLPTNNVLPGGNEKPVGRPDPGREFRGVDRCLGLVDVAIDEQSAHQRPDALECLKKRILLHGCCPSSPFDCSREAGCGGCWQIHHGPDQPKATVNRGIIVQIQGFQVGVNRLVNVATCSGEIALSDKVTKRGIAGILIRAR
jgi:hypothetical protein